MTEVTKVPYYKMESTVFRGRRWKKHSGSDGCVPLDTPMRVSYERLAPGKPAPPPPPRPPKLTKQQKADQAAEAAREEARQKVLAQQAKEQEKQQKEQAKAQKAKPPAPTAEKVDKLPPFDLQDIPVAMEKGMGWPVSAKLAREWLKGPKHIYNNDMNSVQPLDDTTITLDWCLTFGSVQDDYDELLSQRIYSEHARNLVRSKLTPVFDKQFQSSVSMSFNTDFALKDIRQFHIDWQFQFVTVPSRHTLTALNFMTDLTGSLANFNIYAAIGKVEVTGERYYKTDAVKRIKTYCFDPKAKVTHIYVYVKDNYSFNDTDGKTQYLGHWNKNGVITTLPALFSEWADGESVHTQFDNSPITRYSNHWENLIDKPVDTRPGFRKFREENVYYPVYNKTYNDWREQHNQGQDFMIYSKPKLVKLKKPIEISLGTVCRPPEKM